MQFVSVDQQPGEPTFIKRDGDSFTVIPTDKLLTEDGRIKADCLFNCYKGNRFGGIDYQAINDYCKQHSIDVGWLLYVDTTPDEHWDTDRVLDEVCWDEAY